MLPGCWTLPIDCSRSHPLHGSSLPFPRWRRRRNSSSRLPPPGSLAVAARPLPGAAPSHPGPAHPACCWAQRGLHDVGPRDDPAPPEPRARDDPDAELVPAQHLADADPGAGARELAEGTVHPGLQAVRASASRSAGVSLPACLAMVQAQQKVQVQNICIGGWTKRNRWKH